MCLLGGDFEGFFRMQRKHTLRIRFISHPLALLASILEFPGPSIERCRITGLVPFNLEIGKLHEIFPFDRLLPPKPNTRITTPEDRRQSRLIFGEQRFFVNDIPFPSTSIPFSSVFLPYIPLKHQCWRNQDESQFGRHFPLFLQCCIFMFTR